MVKRDIWDELKKELKRDEILVLTGSRQVGKTTTIKWLLSQIKSENKHFFDLENISNRKLFLVQDYDSIIQEFQRLNLNTSEKMYIAIDEIQFLPELPSIVKYLYDHYNIKFLITGSSSYYLKNLFNESMAGRKMIYELFPLSFNEFLRFKGVDYTLQDFNFQIKYSQFSYDKLKFFYDEYIEFGGLPKVVLTLDQKEKKEQLQMIFSSYINLDVKALSDFKSIKEFARMVELLAGRIGNKVNTSQLSKILGISRQTVDSYLSFMEQTYLIRLIQTYSKSANVKLRKSPKLYFVDTGIANINYDLSVGVKYENTVCHQLFLKADQNVFSRELAYFSDKDSEIDFILNNEYAFEVKDTPLNTDLVKLSNNASKIDISKYRLIGNNKAKSFDDFIWGGMIS